MLVAMRREHAVGEQDAEERADERRGDVVADLLGPAVDVAHGDDDAEHGGDDAEAGQRVTGRLEERDRLRLFLVERLDLGVEEQRRAPRE